VTPESSKQPNYGDRCYCDLDYGDRAERELREKQKTDRQATDEIEERTRNPTNRLPVSVL